MLVHWIRLHLECNEEPLEVLKRCSRRIILVSREEAIDQRKILEVEVTVRRFSG